MDAVDSVYELSQSLSREQRELLLEVLHSRKRDLQSSKQGDPRPLLQQQQLQRPPLQQQQEQQQQKQNNERTEQDQGLPRLQSSETPYYYKLPEHKSLNESLNDEFEPAFPATVDENLDLDFNLDELVTLKQLPGFNDALVSPPVSDEASTGNANENESGEKRKDLPDNDNIGSEGKKRRETGAARKPGRKPLTTEPPTKRKAQNRAAQRAFRERKEKHVKDLETTIMMLEKSSRDANHENSVLRAEIAQLRNQVNSSNYGAPVSTGQRRISNSTSSSFSPAAASNETEMSKQHPGKSEPAVNDSIDFTTTNQPTSDFSFRFPTLGGIPSNGAPNSANRDLSFGDSPYNTISNPTSARIPGYIAPGILTTDQSYNPHPATAFDVHTRQYDKQSSRISPDTTSKGIANPSTTYRNKNETQTASSSSRSSPASTSPGSSKSYNTEMDSHPSATRHDLPREEEYNSYKQPTSTFDQAADLAFLSNSKNNTALDTGRHVDSTGSDPDAFKITDANNFYAFMSSLANSNNEGERNGISSNNGNNLPATMDNSSYPERRPVDLTSVATAQPAISNLHEPNPSQLSQTQPDSLLFPPYTNTQDQSGPSAYNKSSPFFDWLASRTDDNSSLFNTLDNISDPIMPTSLGPDYFTSLPDPSIKQFPSQGIDTSLASNAEDTALPPLNSAPATPPVDQSDYLEKDKVARSLIEICDRAVCGQDEGEKKNRADKTPLSCPQKTEECSKIWQRVQTMPEFQNGDFLMDSLCSELKNKAYCSETGRLMPEKAIEYVQSKGL